MLTTRLPSSLVLFQSLGPCLRRRPGISIQSLIYLKLMVCFFTGLATGDLLVACVYIHFKTQGMNLAYGAVALVVVNAAQFMCSVIISQTTLRGALPVLFGTLSAAGWALIYNFPTCEPLFVVAGLFFGLGEQISYMQRVAGQIGESHALEKKSHSWMWCSNLAGYSVAISASGVIYDTSWGFQGVSLMGGVAQIGATMSTAVFILLSATGRNKATLKRAAEARETSAAVATLQTFPSKMMYAGTMLSIFNAAFALSAILSGCFVRWQREFGIAPALSGIYLCIPDITCFAITFIPCTVGLSKIWLLKNPLDMTWTNASIAVGMGLYSVNVGPASLLGGLLVVLGFDLGISAANKTLFAYVPSNLVAKHIVYGSGISKLGQMMGCACTLLLSSEPTTAAAYLWAATALATLTCLAVAMFTLKRVHSLAAKLPRNVSAWDLLQGSSEFETLEIELSNRLNDMSTISLGDFGPAPAGPQGDFDDLNTIHIEGGEEAISNGGPTLIARARRPSYSRLAAPPAVRPSSRSRSRRPTHDLAFGRARVEATVSSSSVPSQRSNPLPAEQ